MQLLGRRKSHGRTSNYQTKELNWGHPLANALALYIKPDGANAVDLVSGAVYAGTGGCVTVPTLYGQALDCTAASRGVQQIIAGPPRNFTTPWDGMTILWAGYTPDPTAMTTFARLATLSYTNANSGPFDVIGLYVNNFFGSRFADLSFNSAGAQSTVNNSGSGAFVANQFTHKAAIVRAGTAQPSDCWSDDLRTAQNTFTLPLGPNYGANPGLVIGYMWGTSDNCNTFCTGVCLWDRALADEEIRYLWQNGLESMLITPRKFFAAFSQGVARHLTASLQSISDVRGALSNKAGFSSRLESISNLNAPILYKATSLSSTNVESISTIKAPVLYRTTSIFPTRIESISDLRNNIVNNKFLVSYVQSISDVQAALGRIFIGGTAAFSVDMKSLAPTSYVKNFPRPIAYLKNDNDNTGVTNESPQSSPGYDIFP